ncbi:hypothetical protein BLNAU_18713 [Blattamonas nauphoetae]|uniref:Nuclear-export cofactor Arc1-like N-terminal domain-containing protein n=1 Tax=Blattamonas nauphoetae TaxID=2049346 RepID=A0ABQ9X3L1_9EUKA|nr:hypothetical protein BLNAU_18713 [Blattamonas nauphoetae]
MTAITQLVLAIDDPLSKLGLTVTSSDSDPFSLSAVISAGDQNGVSAFDAIINIVKSTKKCSIQTKPKDQAEIDSLKDQIVALSQPQVSDEVFEGLNKILLNNVFIISGKFTVVDALITLSLFRHMPTLLKKENAYTRFCNVIRYFDFIQHQKIFGSVFTAAKAVSGAECVTVVDCGLPNQTAL